MSDATKAVLIAALAGLAILLGPLTLLATGVIGPGAMIAIQAVVLAGIYLAAVVIRGRREDG